MRSGALRIAIIYTIAALVWIAFSDRVLYLFHNSLSPDRYLAINSGKGVFFVLLNTFFMYKLIRLHEWKLVKSIQRSNQADDEIKRLGEILTKVNNLIFITDKKNFITWVNKAFVDFTGYTLEDVSGYTPATFFIGEETDIEVLNTILRKKNSLEAFSTEAHCHKKNGDKFWAYGEYTPLYDDKNEFTGYIAVYNDITWLKDKEQEITSQNEKLRQLAWLSSHELRRPLANIQGLLTLLKISSSPDEKNKILENINRSAEELDQILHAINEKIGNELQDIYDK